MDEFITTLTIGQTTYPIYAFEGEEALSQPFQFRIDIYASITYEQLTKLLLANANLQITSHDCTRNISGVITQVEQIGYLETQQNHYRLTLQSRLALLQQSCGPRAFTNCTLHEIITQILLQHGYTPNQVNWEHSNKTKTDIYINSLIQSPHESDLIFVNNLLSHYELFYYSITQNNCEIVYFVSDCRNLSRPFAALKYYPATNLVPDNFANGIYDLAVHYSEKQLLLTATSNLITITPSVHLAIDCELYNSSYSGDYFVIKLYHTAQQQTLSLIPSNSLFQTPHIPSPRMPLCVGHIKNTLTSTYPDLDSQGRYHLHYHFDLNKQLISSIASLTPYAGSTTPQQTASGFHLPLNDGDEVIVSFVDDDTQRPIIIGSLPHEFTQSPVTSNNPYECYFKSQSGNQLFMSDMMMSNKIKLATANDQTMISLDNTSIQPTITVLSQQGEMNFFAGQDISITAHQDMHENCLTDRKQIITNNHICEIGNDSYYRAPNQQITAEEDVKIAAGEHLIMNSGQDFNITCQQGLTINAHGQACDFTALAGEVSFKSMGDDILLQGSGEKPIHIGNSQGSITINPDGSIILSGHLISLIGVQSLIFKGTIKGNIS